MITLSQALEWLTQLNPSQLSETNQFAIWQIRSAGISDAEKDQRIDALLQKARASDNPFYQAEVYANCARLQAERNRLTQAVNLLEQAEIIYAEKQDSVRQGVILWMMSIIEWKLLDNLKAHSHARRARELFEQAAKAMLLEKKDGRVDWILARIQEMHEDLASTPEEAYHWLNQFEAGHLKVPSIQIKNAIEDALRDRQFPRVYQLMNTLLDLTRNSSEPKETAEVLAACGLVNAQMGNAREAVRLLRQAAAQYLPESHHQAMVRWMLTLILFTQPLEATHAIQLGNQCIETIQNLMQRADEHHQPDRKAWYEQLAGKMRAILNKKIKDL